MVLPYVPPGHAVQAVEPAKEYCPGAQRTAIGSTQPALQMDPAGQMPLHAAEGKASTAP
jgi:hypothetical protein